MLNVFSLGDSFRNGVPQGSCLGPRLFTIYLKTVVLPTNKQRQDCCPDLRDERLWEIIPCSFDVILSLPAAPETTTVIFRISSFLQTTLPIQTSQWSQTLFLRCFLHFLPAGVRSRFKASLSVGLPHAVGQLVANGRHHLDELQRPLIQV